MISRPQDSIGKWYAVLFGEKNTYIFILKQLGGDWYTIIEMKRASLRVIEVDIEQRFLADPINVPAEISKLNQGLVKKIFKYGISK